MINDPNVIEIFLPKKAVAEKLGISIRTLDKRVKSDPSFPRPRKQGNHRQGSVRFSNKEIDVYMKSCENNSGAN